MNQPFNSSFAVNGVPCNPVNELLAGIMRSFGEEPAPQRDGAGSGEPKMDRPGTSCRKVPKSKI